MSQLHLPRPLELRVSGVGRKWVLGLRFKGSVGSGFKASGLRFWV